MKHSVKAILLVALFSIQPIQADFFKQWAPAIIVGAAAGLGGYFWGYKKGAAKPFYNGDLRSAQIDVVSARVPVAPVRNQQGMNLARDVERQVLLQPLQQENDRLRSENSCLREKVTAQEDSARILQSLHEVRARVRVVQPQSDKSVGVSSVASKQKLIHPKPFAFYAEKSSLWDLGCKN